LFEIFIDANLGPAITLFILEGEHIINFANLNWMGWILVQWTVMSSFIENK
jgi:hypothetical protein